MKFQLLVVLVLVLVAINKSNTLQSTHYITIYLLTFSRRGAVRVLKKVVYFYLLLSFLIAAYRIVRAFRFASCLVLSWLISGLIALCLVSWPWVNI